MNQFLLFNGRVTDERAKAIRAILPEGVGLVLYREAGSVKAPLWGWRGWFTGPNRGHPFDGDLVSQVESALREAKLWPVVPLTAEQVAREMVERARAFSGLHFEIKGERVSLLWEGDRIKVNLGDLGRIEEIGYDEFLRRAGAL